MESWAGPENKASDSDSRHLSLQNKNLPHHSLELMDGPGMRLHDLGHGKQAEVLQVLVRILNKQAELGHTQLQKKRNRGLCHLPYCVRAQTHQG